MTSFQGQPRGGRRAPRSAVNTAGIVLAVIACVAGLAIFAYIVLVFVALANFGSNK